MQTFKGKYNSANVMIDDLEQETISQIYTFLNHPAFAKTYIAIMPDCHAGAGSCIGYTAKMNEYVIPAVVGVDIGCGVLAVPLEVTSIDFEHLDHFIKKNVPSGFNIRSASESLITGKKAREYFDYNDQLFYYVDTTKQEISKVLGSVGTLGGGNHFIEVDQAEDGQYWLLIHSGSRNFGLRIANYYQSKAKQLMNKMFIGADAYKGLEYLPVQMGGEAEEYLAAMKVAQDYAKLNRGVMAEVIVKHFFKQQKWDYEKGIESVHNYINFEDNIIRKGAVSAHEGERLVIPFNMRDGVAICTGKGNTKWNQSAPHGAGRILSRRKAKETLSMDEFTQEMQGIYTTTATKDTLDESPMAYKDKDMIVEAIEETVTIDLMMKPVYNFKAGGE